MASEKEKIDVLKDIVGDANLEGKWETVGVADKVKYRILDEDGNVKDEGQSEIVRKDL